MFEKRLIKVWKKSIKCFFVDNIGKRVSIFLKKGWRKVEKCFEKKVWKRLPKFEMVKKIFKKD